MFPTVAHLTVVLASGLLHFVVGQDSTSLPSVLLDQTPSCAQACLATFVAQNLWGCPTASDIDCLCRTPGANGYTLGEGALACVADECPFEYVGLYSGVYVVCAGQPDAVSPTHSIVSAAVATATIDFSQDQVSTTSSTSSLTTPSTRATSSSSTHSRTKTTTRKTSTTVSALTSTLSSTSTTTLSATPTSMTSLEFDSSTPPAPRIPTWTETASATPSFTQIGAAATSTAAAAARSVLNTGQAAGIAIGGAVLGAAVIGILIFVFCGKKSKRQERSAHDEEAVGEQSPYFPERGGSNGSDFAEVKPDTPLIPQPPMPPRSRQGGSKAHQFLGLPMAPNQHRQSWWNKFGRNSVSQPPPPPVPPKRSSQIGMARYLTPTMGGVSSEPSPKSTASYHTTSKLLPDKPAYPTAGREIHEKRCSGETAANQPIPLAAGVGLRIISATPEPSHSRQISKGWPQANTSQRDLQQQNSTEQNVLRGKLSDPFIARTHDQNDNQVGLTPAFRASRNQLPKIDTLKGQRDNDNLPNQGRQPAWRQSAVGVPNFRSLVNPQSSVNTSAPPQLPEADVLSPLTPGFVATGGLSQERGDQYQGSIMNRPRGVPSPFFSSQPSQYYAYQQPRRERKKLRPETHYTTSSETEFEDDEPSPMSAFGYDQKTSGPVQSFPKTHISIGGVAELPALSPVTESPASKQTPSSGRSTSGWPTKTPSPRVIGTPARSTRGGDLDSDDGSVPTPLSQIRYPEIPGTRASPKHEVKSINIAMGVPRMARAVHVGQLQEAPNFPPLPRGDAGTQDDADSESDSGHLVLKKTRTKLQPSPLRPSKAQNNLREIAVAQSPSQKADVSPPSHSSPLRSPYRTPPREIDQPEIAELPSPSEPPLPAAKFHSAASRLAASNAGLRGPAAEKRGLGNWPVQPVRPVTNIRNTKIPAPISVPAFAGSQPATPIDGRPTFANREDIIADVDEVALSRSNDGPFQVAGDVVRTSHQGHSANEGRARSSSRILIAGHNGRAMHAPILSPTQIPAPVPAGPRVLQPAFEPQRSFNQHLQSQINSGSSHRAPEDVSSVGWGNPARFIHTRNVSQSSFNQTSHEQSYRPSADFGSFQQYQQSAVSSSEFQEQPVASGYRGPSLSVGPNRYAKAPIRETEREREVRMGLAKLRGWEQERRRDLQTEAYVAGVAVERRAM